MWMGWLGVGFVGANLDVGGAKIGEHQLNLPCAQKLGAKIGDESDLSAQMLNLRTYHHVYECWQQFIACKIGFSSKTCKLYY